MIEIRPHLKVSRLSFGTASLFRIGPLQDQAKLLQGAADAGFSHFDTSPLYGFGQSEMAIGAAFSRRCSVTVATKVGLYPPRDGETSRLSTITRKAAGKLFPSLSRAKADWSVSRARNSLDLSLRRLKREVVDICFLHEPSTEILETDEWLRWMETERVRVRYFGLAGYRAQIEPLLKWKEKGELVIQAHDSLEQEEACFLRDQGYNPDFTFGYFANSSLSAPIIIKQILERNPFGSAIVYSSKPERIAQFGNALRRQNASR